MTRTTGTEHDELTLGKLSEDHIHSDQYSDATRILDVIARPRPFIDLTVHDVTIRAPGDFALHVRAPSREWKCIAGEVVARDE
jgi:hypothetical protein